LKNNIKKEIIKNRSNKKGNNKKIENNKNGRNIKLIIFTKRRQKYKIRI